jgi:hypothetical protein
MLTRRKHPFLSFLIAFLISTRYPCAIVMAEDNAEDILSRVTGLVTGIINVCIVLIPSLIFLGILLGYIQIAGPWGIQSVRKSGRMQIEMGFVTLFIFAISPALLGFLLWIANSLGGQ